jgi:hypothetical protein
MRPRRFVVILERRLLGAAMSVVLFIVERRLSRGSVDAGRPGRETESVRPPSPDGANVP